MKIYWKAKVEKRVPCPDVPTPNPYTGEVDNYTYCLVNHFVTETKEMSKEIKDVSEFDDFKSRAPYNCYDFKLEL